MSVAFLRRAARLGFWASAAVVVMASFVPGWIRDLTPFPGRYEHFAGYCALGFALELAYGDRFRPGTIPLFLIVIAAALEAVQLLIPSRHANFADFAASATGALIGVALALLILRLLGRRTVV
jgi:VanZ family protein